MSAFDVPSLIHDGAQGRALRRRAVAALLLALLFHLCFFVVWEKASGIPLLARLAELAPEATKPPLQLVVVDEDLPDEELPPEERARLRGRVSRASRGEVANPTLPVTGPSGEKEQPHDVFKPGETSPLDRGAPGAAAPAPQAAPAAEPAPPAPPMSATPPQPPTPPTPTAPEKPENPESPEIPDNPEKPEAPQKTEAPTAPEKPDNPESPETPETPELPEAPETPAPPAAPAPTTPPPTEAPLLALAQPRPEPTPAKPTPQPEERPLAPALEAPPPAPPAPPAVAATPRAPARPRRPVPTRRIGGGGAPANGGALRRSGGRAAMQASAQSLAVLRDRYGEYMDKVLRRIQQAIYIQQQIMPMMFNQGAVVMTFTIDASGRLQAIRHVASAPEGLVQERAAARQVLEDVRNGEPLPRPTPEMLADPDFQKITINFIFAPL